VVRSTTTLGTLAGIKPIQIDTLMLERITERALWFQGLSDSGAIQSLEHSFLGAAAGEILFAQTFHGATTATEQEDRRGIDFHYRGLTVDVKCATQNLPFLMDIMEGEIPAYSEKHIGADILVFCRVSLRDSLGWVVAWCPTRRFFEQAQWYAAGQKVAHMPRPLRVAMYRMKYVHMRPISELL
jgi:hypothetical protein